MIAVDNILKPTSARPEYLAVVRMIFSSWVLFESFGMQFQVFSQVGGTDYTVTVFPVLVTEWVTEYIDLLLLGLRISAVLAFLGLMTKFSTWALAVLYLLVYLFHYSFFDAPVPWLYGWFPLLVLALSLSGDRWSIDSVITKRKSRRLYSCRYGWPLDALRLWFVYIYVSAGISKLFPLSGVFSWIANSPTQEILVFRYPHSMSYYLFGRPLFDYSTHSELISIGALIVLILELSVLVMIFTDKIDYILLFAIFLMHGLLWLVGVPNFGLASFVLMSAIVFRRLSAGFK